ncbi:MAG: GNAT family N-acetyltransferase [Vampirovibrionales bacterium]
MVPSALVLGVSSPFLKTPRLVLRPLCLQDALPDAPYHHWFQAWHPATGLTRHGRFPYTSEQAQQYVQQTHAMMQAQEGLVLAIVLQETDTHIGNIALTHLDWIHRSGEFAIIIGSTEHQGKGYAHEASHTLLGHGFDKLGLHRVGCGTPAPHIAMQKLALKLGFHEEGRRKEAFRMPATETTPAHFTDVVMYGCLRLIPHASMV